MSEVKRGPPPPRNSNLHTFSDNSILRKMSARDIVKISIWHGNRILDEDHKKAILGSLKQSPRELDLKPFHIVSYPDEDDKNILHYKLVDGQHRVSIIRESDQQDFDVLVVEKRCNSEREVIEYFRILNQTKSIEWREDPIMVANTFVHALENAYNPEKEKDKKIRQKSTHRPYLYVDTFRDELKKRKIGLDGKTPEEFVQFAREKNRVLLERLGEGKDKTEKRALEMGFALALDPKFKWLDDF